MPVWRPPPGLPECEWTLLNTRQTYTDTPAAIGPWGGKSVWATSNNNNNKANCMPGFLFFTASPITRRRYHRRGAWKDGSVDKKTACQGSLLAPALPQWVWVRDRRHTLQLTPTLQTGDRDVSKSAFQNHNATIASKWRHWNMQECSNCLNICLPNSLTNMEWSITSSLTTRRVKGQMY